MSTVEACPLNRGDLVFHRMGGPTMQVVTVHSAKQVECDWFDAHGTPHRKGFMVADLLPVPAAPAVEKAKGDDKKADDGEAGEQADEKKAAKPKGKKAAE